MICILFRHRAGATVLRLLLFKKHSDLQRDLVTRLLFEQCPGITSRGQEPATPEVYILENPGLE